MALYVVNDGSVVSAADVNQFTNLLNGTTSGVQITNAGRIRAQLTGATTGTGGYVGESPNLSAPTTGAFLAGDFASDGAGLVWVCRSAGSPGLWNALPTQIATTTLGTTTASVTFSSIPAFVRIWMTWRVRTSASGATDLLLQVDGNTGNNYLWSKIESNAGVAGASHAGAATSSIKIGVVDGNTTSYFGSGHQMLDGWNNATGFMTTTGPYSNFSTVTADWSGTASGQYSGVGPHTSIKIAPGANSFAAGSQFTIYGLM